MVEAVKLPSVHESGMPVTLQDCANLATGVYEDVSNAYGWKQISHQGFGDGPGGFFGAAYRRDMDVIIALRGTSDTTDIIDDASMAPFKTPAEARNFGVQFVRFYTKTNEAEARQIASVMEAAWKAKILERGKMLILGERLNNVPSSQTTELDKFLFRLGGEMLGYNLRIRAFVGHSLGGALAQAASENYSRGPFMINTLTGSRTVMKRISIPAVAFNGPYMGTMEGMHKGHGPGILCVNTAHDPLSVATSMARNETHAKYIEKVEGHHAPRSAVRQSTGDFLSWLGTELGYGHSMKMLRHAMEGGVGRHKLSHYFPVTLGIAD
ncbi:hypothetical protein BH11PSE2_BH11PSE2_06750 [soil metagenome]